MNEDLISIRLVCSSIGLRLRLIESLDAVLDESGRLLAQKDE